MDWAEVELRYNSLDPEPRGFLLGMLEAWAWDHPFDQEISSHRMPILNNYDGTQSISGFFDYDFDPLTFEAAVNYWGNEGQIWWYKFYIKEGDLWVDLATTENNPGLPDDWDDRPSFDHAEWIRVYQEWVDLQVRRMNELR